jgi:hypothetical protein
LKSLILCSGTLTKAHLNNLNRHAFAQFSTNSIPLQIHVLFFIREIKMTDADKYVLDAIKAWVWSGFYSPADVDEMIDDILEGGEDEDFLRAAIEPEFEKKAEQEKLWPAETDCDRLDAAFSALETYRVLALHNAGYTMSEGHQEAFEIMQDHNSNNFIGYCFYHGQDVEHALAGDGLMIAFDHVNDDVPGMLKIGETVVAVLRSAGFEVEWNGNPDKRIHIPEFDWKRRDYPS